MMEKGLEPTFVVRNNFKDWANVVDLTEVPYVYQYLLRCEWSRDRSAEYLRAALDNSGVKNRLLHDGQAVFLVAGILQGSDSSDPLDIRYSPTEQAVGYRLLKAVINTGVELLAKPALAPREKGPPSITLSSPEIFLELDEVRSDSKPDTLEQKPTEDTSISTIPATKNASVSTIPDHKVRSSPVTQLTDKTNSNLRSDDQQMTSRPSKMQEIKDGFRETVAHVIKHVIREPFETMKQKRQLKK
jgi:hypothetical protein